MEKIHTWNNVNYDYPQCGGSIGTVYADGKVEVEYCSNMQGHSTGGSSVWQLLPDALAAIAADPTGDYNDHYSYADMLQGDGIAYIATLVSTTKGWRVE